LHAGACAYVYKQHYEIIGSALNQGQVEIADSKGLVSTEMCLYMMVQVCMLIISTDLRISSLRFLVEL
jgi:hypothetical protein